MRILFLLLAAAGLAAAQSAAPSIAAKIAPWKKMPGYFPMYYDEHAGKLYLEVQDWGKEFLFQDSLPAGVGSNDLGLDRGQLGETRIVKFERSGAKVLLVQSNYGFRASSSNPARNWLSSVISPELSARPPSARKICPP